MEKKPRWRDVPLEGLSPAQREIYEDIREGERGNVPAPLRVWLTSPPLASAAERLGKYCRFATSLPARLSEVAILTVGAHWRSSFEWSTHAPLARRAGVSAETLEALRLGTSVPQREDERVIHGFARELLEQRRVCDATFERLKFHVGMQGVVDVVAIVGYYSLICMTINTFEIPNVAQTPEPFPAPDAGSSVPASRSSGSDTDR